MNKINVVGNDPECSYLVACEYNMRGTWRANSETGVGGHFLKAPIQQHKKNLNFRLNIAASKLGEECFVRTVEIEHGSGVRKTTRVIRLFY
jgi:hypothetical protein